MHARHPRRRLLAACLLALSLCAAPAASRERTAEAQATHAISAERLARIDRAWRDYVDSGRLAGAVLLVQQDGRTVYSRAWGLRDREAGDPMREDTIFRIASQTKALVSVAAMMLVEDGRLLLDDPVGKHLPGWNKTTVAVAKDGGGYAVVPAKRPITIRDLLTHTAGIAYASGDEGANRAWRDAGIEGFYFADRDQPMAHFVARMAALPMAAQPGEKFVYGYATDILGVVVERISGQSLDAFLHERLFAPLGMRDTHFFLPPEKAGRLATVYSAAGQALERAPGPGSEGGGRWDGQGSYVEGPRKAMSGGAGLLSTAHDYGRFLEMLRRGGELGGRRYLGRKSVELMTVDQLGDVASWTPGAGFGLGFEVIEDLGRYGRHGSAGAFGWGGAYHSRYWVDPAEGLVVVYLTQLTSTGGLDDHERLRALVYQAIE